MHSINTSLLVSALNSMMERAVERGNQELVARAVALYKVVRANPDAEDFLVSDSMVRELGLNAFALEEPPIPFLG